MLATVGKLLLFVASSISCMTMGSSVRHDNPHPPNITMLTDRFPHSNCKDIFSDLFGSQNIEYSNNGSSIRLTLDETSGSGLKSRDVYYYGFFSAAIKLPSYYSAGVVVAFYMSNAEVYPHNHDEIDFELLGHEKRKDWVLQTNLYGNGSVTMGREEKFYLWFDPTVDFHQYSIIWNQHHTVFLVDNIPVREVNNSKAMSGVYPMKPMSVYATIWDGSEWATHGGKKPVNYKFSPFVAYFEDLEIEGCTWNQNARAPSCYKNGEKSRLSLDPVQGNEFVKLSEQQQTGLAWARSRFMFYSYCKDLGRFKVIPPECK